MSKTVAPLVVTVREAAEALGCHRDTVRRLIRSGELPAFRVGVGTKCGKVVIRRATLESFLDKRERQAKV